MIGSSAQIIAEHKRKLLAVARTSIEMTAKGVVGRWAVDTGSSANSWIPNIGSFRARYVETTGGDISPALNAIDRVVARVEPGDVFTHGNGAPYSQILEFHGGSQRQMPNGAMRITLAMHQQTTDEAVRINR